MLPHLIGFAAWGLLVGLLVGFTAIGTALLGIPGLIVLFQVPAVPAVGSMAVAGFFMMVSGTLQHYRNGNVLASIALPFAATAVPGSYIAATYARAINEFIPLETILGTVIIISVVVLFYRYIIMRAKPRELSLPRWKFMLSPMLGLVLGVLMGATSISGSIIVIAFIMLLKLPSPQAVGTTSFVAAVSLLVASVAHIQQANVEWLVVAGLTPGMFVGATLGARYVDRLPRQALRVSILVILFVAGIMVFFG